MIRLVRIGTVLTAEVMEGTVIAREVDWAFDSIVHARGPEALAFVVLVDPARSERALSLLETGMFRVAMALSKYTGYVLPDGSMRTVKVRHTGESTIPAWMLAVFDGETVEWLQTVRKLRDL